MRILIFHGYLLGGTGSNVYNARLAAALVRAGHEVHLLSQEREPFDQDWVDAAGDWDGGDLAVRARREPVRATVYRPDLGGLLPVYVADRYDGIEAKPFPDLTDAELARYLERNVAAVREVAELVAPDVALANHLVMGPAVLARALDGVPYAVKVHGSALEYTVKPNPERFLPYAREGLAGAQAVLVGSRHTAESLWAAMDDPGLEARTKLGPPGVDIAEFTPREPEAAREGLAALVERLRHAPAGDPDSSFARDPAAAAAALADIQPEDRLVVFVGKLIASKGVDLLLAAWPLVVERVPDARLVIVGFGAFREGLERLAADLDAGDLDAVRATRGENGLELRYLRAFLDGAPEGYGQRAWSAWCGPGGSTTPSSPTCCRPPRRSWSPARSRRRSGWSPPRARPAARCPSSRATPGSRRSRRRSPGRSRRPPGRCWASTAGRARCASWPRRWPAGWRPRSRMRAATREAMVAITRERYSWDGVARTMLAAAQGRLDGLPTP